MILFMGQKFKFLCKPVPGSKIVSELMQKTRGAWEERRSTAFPRSRPSNVRLACFPDLLTTILEPGTGYSVEFPVVFQRTSCSQIIQDTSSFVYSSSPAVGFVCSRNAVGEERYVTRQNCCCENPPYKHLKLGYTLSECTLH